jgi:type VI secretion system secreted protein VgrG
MAGRQTTLAIDLGGEQIRLRRVESIEGLSRPFQVNVDLFSKLGELDLLPHLGKACAVSVSEDGELLRYFNGFVTDGEYLSETRDGFHYRLIVRPWSYFLSHNSNFAIFQEKSVIDIIKAVLSTSPFAQIDYGKIKNTPPVRPYTVQYGESDFAFISRLMEEEGIYYFYEHTNDKHRMVLCDSPSAHEQGRHPLLVYNPNSASVGNVDSAARSSSAARQFLSQWHERVTTGGEAKVTFRDFDFEKPQKPVEAKVSAPGVHPLDALEVYHWPGAHKDEAGGKRLGTVVLDSRRAERQTYSGESQLASLTAGQKFKLSKHPNGRFNREYLITRAHHIVSAEIYSSGSEGGEHNVMIEAVSSATQWRAPLSTPRPVVRGPETAVVTGPPGEEIYTDEFGRVKVRFHWDRASTPGEKSTCWIRVSQTGGLGNIIMPRVGHEVLVDFLDGDPDRPLVVGRVFNKEHMPIYKLPDHKTRALWRTKTYGAQGSYGAAQSLDTGAPKANELRFEDKGGKEEVFLHAERDMNLRVRHKETHHIGLDQEVKIGGSRKTRIEVADALDVGKSIKVTAGTTIHIEAKSSITLKCGQSTIKIDPTSITIQTVQFKTTAQAMAEVKSPLTTVKGDGLLTLKGGMTMINC